MLIFCSRESIFSLPALSHGRFPAIRRRCRQLKSADGTVLWRLSAAITGYAGSRAFAGRPAPAGQQAGFSSSSLPVRRLPREPRSLHGVSMASATTSLPLFQTDLQLIEIRFVAFDLLLLTQCGLREVPGDQQPPDNPFQIRLPGTVCALPAHAPYRRVCITQPPVADAKYVTRDETRGLCPRWTALVGVTHVVRRHVVGSFADQMLKNRSRSDW